MQINGQNPYSNSSLGSKLRYRYHSRLPWAPSLICCWTFHLGWNSWILLRMLISTYLKVIVIIMVKLRMDSYDAAESSSDWHSHIIMWIKFSDHKNNWFLQLHFQSFSMVLFISWNLVFRGRYLLDILYVCLVNWALIVESQYVLVNLIPWMRHTHGMKRQTLKIWMLLGYRPDLIFNLDSITLFGKGCNNLGSQ